jgi:hypothetical protein
VSRGVADETLRADWGSSLRYGARDGGRSGTATLGGMGGEGTALQRRRQRQP